MTDKLEKKKEKKKIEKLTPRSTVEFSNLQDALTYINEWLSDVEDKVNEIIEGLNDPT